MYLNRALIEPAESMCEVSECKCSVKKTINALLRYFLRSIKALVRCLHRAFRKLRARRVTHIVLVWGHINTLFTDINTLFTACIEPCGRYARGESAQGLQMIFDALWTGLLRLYQQFFFIFSRRVSRRPPGALSGHCREWGRIKKKKVYIYNKKSVLPGLTCRNSRTL